MLNMGYSLFGLLSIFEEISMRRVLYMGTRLFLCIFYSFLVDLGDGVLFWYIWKKISVDQGDSYTGSGGIEKTI